MTYQKQRLLGKQNFVFVLIGLALILVGFFIMAGGATTDPNVYPEDWGPQTRLEVYNMCGQRLLTREIAGLQTTVSLDRMSSQVLMVRLYDPKIGHKLTRRLVVQR